MTFVTRRNAAMDRSDDQRSEPPVTRLGGEYRSERRGEEEIRVLHRGPADDDSLQLKLWHNGRRGL
jgi:hypothetical protein